MNGLQVFKFRDNQVRVIEKDGEPWWVLKDVCDVLGLSNARMIADRLDEDDVSQTYTIDSLNRQQQTNVVNESGLYNVIIRSDKPEAKQFKRWITHEVLPTIRKHGAYMAPVFNIPKTLPEALRYAAEIEEKRAALAAKVEEDAPKVLFADSVSTSHTEILVGELAKILKQNGYEIGQNRLFEILRNDGYLMKTGSSWNMPTQYSMERGLFRVKETTINKPDGSIHISKTVKVTGRGQLYFVNKFLSGGLKNVA